ncbi:unnamed protein product [Amoebophrya sp. A25]|nr:unnamed protein product [Amoebophrya sp. A25]|eukprot:GSA25T00021282001.1
MSHGRVAEDGVPWELMQNPSSHLNHMLESNGPETATALRRTAQLAAAKNSATTEEAEVDHISVIKSPISTYSFDTEKIVTP